MFEVAVEVGVLVPVVVVVAVVHEPALDQKGPQRWGPVI